MSPFSQICVCVVYTDLHFENLHFGYLKIKDDWIIFLQEKYFLQEILVLLLKKKSCLIQCVTCDFFVIICEIY